MGHDELENYVDEDQKGSSEKTLDRDDEGKEESCLVSSWRCISAVLEQGVICFQRPGAFQR